MQKEHLMRFASAAALVLFCGSVNAASLLLNGDFELDDPDVASNGYTRVGAGQSTIDNWTVVGTSVDLIQGWAGTISGVSVDLAGTPGPGGIEQSFSAVANYSYRLSWDYFTNAADPINFAVSFRDSSGDLASVSIPNAPSSITSSFLDFVAPTTGSYSVRFYSSNATNAGPTVDNIALVVTAVPEPAEWAMLIGGLAVLGVFANRRARKERD